MQTICYYISDHGWGHAARAIAIIRALLQASLQVRVVVKTDFSLGFMRQSLRTESLTGRVKFSECRNDFGFCTENGSVEVNREQTANSLEKWLRSWDEFVEQEKAFCRQQRARLIISDIPPQPFLVADALGIPSIGITNFTWVGLYRRLFSTRQQANIATIEDAYRHAKMGLVLPLNEKVLPFRRQIQVGLVVRKRSIERDSFREELGIPLADKIVYIGMGKSVDPRALEGLVTTCSALKDDVRFLFSSGSNEIPIRDMAPQSMEVPAGDSESQNYVGMCDLVVAKAGYSTVSEAIAAEIPMVLFERVEIDEEARITAITESLGLARGIKLSGSSFSGRSIRGEFRTVMLALLNSPKSKFERAYATLPRRYRKNGNREVVNYILDIIGEA